MKLLALNAIAFLGIAVFLGSCGASSGQTTFNVSEWKAATPPERRKMAEDFLRKYDTKSLTMEDIKGLLGEPDYEQDKWCYDISISGPISPDTTSASQALKDVELCVFFKQGSVKDVGITYSLKLHEDMKFDSAQWKASKSGERLKMAASLINSQILQNKTKQEVQEILGNAERKSNYIEIGYDLGLRVIDHVYLVFFVGGDSKILEAKIEEH